MSGIAINVTIYPWPYSQICLECTKGLEGMDTEYGLFTGFSRQSFSICSCCEYDNDGVNCPSFKRNKL